MRLKSALFNLSLAAVLAAPAVQTARADEGMWTYDNFPSALVKERYGVNITPAWLDKVRTASVRLSNCTATFVSGDGLILTNHHCVAACLAQLSNSSTDRLRDGFIAAARNDELRCPTQRADVLMKIEDVTAKVNAATAGKTAAAAGDARRQALTQLEQACEKSYPAKDPRRCESVNLYKGGQYFLYHYKRFDDVRIVFAPEEAIAAFGGDPDNFQFPRWCLDMGVLRAYENGKPARTPNHLKINWNGPAAGDPVFVSGHPGTTNRLLTVAQYENLRLQQAFTVLRNSELRGRYLQFAKLGAEQARITADPLSSLENSLKVQRKQLDALLEPEFLKQKQAAEQELRARAQVTGEDPWQQIERAVQRQRELYAPYLFIEGAVGFNSQLFRHARTLVRAAAERSKPNGERLREFVDTALPRTEQQLSAAVPVYAELEQLTLSFGLERMREFLGADHPLVRNLLAELSPDELARGLVMQSRLADPTVRMALWNGGQAAIDASDDPMIRIAKLVDEEARALRKQYEDEVDSPIDAAAERIAAARFAVYGTNVYPDATFTLRLNFGSVQGWNEAGKPVEPFTTLARAYERATGAEPFALPASWLQKKDQLDPATPFNLSTNSDIIGGNSGSALVSAKGEIVGLLFDGNIHSISGSYWYDTVKNRAVGVHPAIMKVALKQVYDVPALARELGL